MDRTGPIVGSMMSTNDRDQIPQQFVGVAELLLQQARGLNRDGFKDAAVYVCWLGEAFRCAAACGCPACLAEIESRKRWAQSELEKVGGRLHC